MSIGIRPFNKLPEEGIVAVHDPLSPAEIYSGQLITACLRNRGDKDFTRQLPVYRLSPLGAELDVSSLPIDQIKVGCEIDLRLDIGKQKCDFFGIAVASVHDENGRRLIGVRWCQRQQVDSQDEDRRKFTRWLCSDRFLPSGMAPNPARFNDFVYFTVTDISNRGMQLVTSLRNKFLIPGMVLEAGVSFPMVGQLTVHLRIINARIKSENGKDYLALGVQILSSSPEILETIGQYLMQFGPPLSVADLKASGLFVRSMESAVNFKFVKTAEEYKEILALRKLAYSMTGKFDASSDSENMGDFFDSKSRILLAKHKDTVVGSLRITFQGPEEQNEYDAFVTFPDAFPRRDEIAVLSRICTHPSYRGSDLFYGLMRQCVLTVLQSRRRYILGGCSESLLPLYKKVGFKPQNLYYQHAALNGVREQIIIADVHGILSGAGTSLAVWNEIYSDLTSYISHLYEVPFDPAMNLRLALYRAASPVTRLFTGSYRNPKRKS